VLQKAQAHSQKWLCHEAALRKAQAHSQEWLCHEAALRKAQAHSQEWLCHEAVLQKAQAHSQEWLCHEAALQKASGLPTNSGRDDLSYKNPLFTKGGHPKKRKTDSSSPQKVRGSLGYKSPAFKNETQGRSTIGGYSSDSVTMNSSSEGTASEGRQLAPAMLVGE
jgi:hypothetical protein